MISDLRILILVAAFTAACTGKYNVARLSRDAKQNTAHLALSTEHYLSLDNDKILELDRGERTLTLHFRRPAALGRPADDAISVALKLYDSDALPQGKIRLEAEGRIAEFEPLDIKLEKFNESVTVLDTGQRQQDNPNLANSAQAQTGYITFGKPAAAGSAQRRWHVYKFTIRPESGFFDVLLSAPRASVFVLIGKRQAEAQAGEKEIRAWRRYAAGDYDERSEAGSE